VSRTGMLIHTVTFFDLTGMLGGEREFLYLHGFEMRNSATVWCLSFDEFPGTPSLGWGFLWCAKYGT